MNKELSFDDIDVDEIAEGRIPNSRIVKIIDEIEFLKEDDEEGEITLSSLGLE